MTIFELLEKLETEIIALRTRFTNLEESMSRSASNGSAPVRKVAARNASARKKKKPAKKPPQKVNVKAAPVGRNSQQQLELQVGGNTAGGEPVERVLGKRQALGRSLVQLRKMSAWKSHRPPEE